MRAQTKLFAITALAISGFALTACGGNAQKGEAESAVEAENTGPWQMSRDQSGMSFITIKKGTIAEVGTFIAIDGKVSEDGNAEFTIVLDSLNTNNEVRDPRMRQYLFKTDQHPYINVKANIDLDGYRDMVVGERRATLLSYTLAISGISEIMESYVMVTRLGTNKVLVESKAPILIDAADFGLEAGVEKLRELANLTSIAPIVPVTFSLVFER